MKCLLDSAERHGLGVRNLLWSGELVGRSRVPAIGAVAGYSVAREPDPRSNLEVTAAVPQGTLATGQAACVTGDRHADARLLATEVGRGKSLHGGDYPTVVFDNKDPGTAALCVDIAPARRVAWLKMSAEIIDLFLRTGDYDLLFLDWPGQNILEKGQRGAGALRSALLAEVRRREAEVTVPRPAALPGDDLASFARAKVEPMVRGLFPRREQEPILALLQQAMVFLTPETIEPLIRKAGLLGTAWQVANVYLTGIGAEPLGGDMGQVVGLSVDTTCYVSLAYFAEEDPFADFVVHEAAHVFHNTKRGTVGLKETRRREWLLPIDYRKRETFAYACEAFSRILEQGKRPGDRQALLERLRRGPAPPDDRVEPEEYLDILAEAGSRRNGWKAILERCSSNGRGA